MVTIMIRRKRIWLFAALALSLLFTSVSVNASEYEQETSGEQTIQVITGFADFNIRDHYLYYSPDNRPTAEEAVAEMPDTLEVYLDGEETATQIDVEWYEVCGDYDDARSYYYQFSPRWDEDLYEASDELNVLADAPYIGVFFDDDPNEVKLSVSSKTGTRNEVAVYHYVTDVMHVNSAVACAILANIECESSFRTDSAYVEASGATSYGICQWNTDRLAALKTYSGEAYTTLEGQLNYLYYELQHSEKSAWSKINTSSNNSQGAYNSAYNWAKYFERCASRYYVVRANLARDKYWPEYGTASETGSSSGNWVQDSYGWRFKDSSGNFVKSKWIKSNGVWYNIKSNGYMAANEWAKDSKGWCYLDQNGRIVRTKWIKSNGAWYYLKTNGYMAVNDWEKDNHGWCRLDENGRIVKNAWINNNNRWYYLKSNGYMAANEWAKDSVGWCWLDKDGIVTKNKWIYYHGEWYYLKTNGYMAANEYAKDSKATYWMNADGTIKR